MARLTVEVTQEDIDLGVPMYLSECPVARATQRATGNTYSWAGPANIYTEIGVYVDTPKIVSDWMYDFDTGQAVQPFSFEIEVPD